ncbi:hypothetical protein E2542_SST04592 [Spatholobus suberectus]|nr:hypothetical protein E2542_SST04592 [Spatholobus suberectus]
MLKTYQLVLLLRIGKKNRSDFLLQLSLVSTAFTHGSHHSSTQVTKTLQFSHPIRIPFDFSPFSLLDSPHFQDPFR